MYIAFVINIYVIYIIIAIVYYMFHSLLHLPYVRTLLFRHVEWNTRRAQLCVVNTIFRMNSSNNIDNITSTLQNVTSVTFYV